MPESVLTEKTASFCLTNYSAGPTRLYFSNKDTISDIRRELCEEWDVLLSHSDVWCTPDGVANFFRDLQDKTFEELEQRGAVNEEDTIYIMMSDVVPPREPPNMVFVLQDGHISLAWESPQPTMNQDLQRFTRQFRCTENEEEAQESQESTPPRDGITTPTSQELIINVHFKTDSLELHLGQDCVFETLINQLPSSWAINSSFALFHGRTRLAWNGTPHEYNFVGGEHIGILELLV